MRERLRDKYLRHSEALGRYWEHIGSWARALECYLKVLEVDDLAEVSTSASWLSISISTVVPRPWLPTSVAIRPLLRRSGSSLPPLPKRSIAL